MFAVVFIILAAYTTHTAAAGDTSCFKGKFGKLFNAKYRNCAEGGSKFCFVSHC
jgi:hypothetical protein